MIGIVMQRFIVSAILLSVFFLAGKTYGFYKKWKISAHSTRKYLRGILKTEKPVLLYFWTSDCAQCKPQERQIEKAITGLRQSGKTLEVQKYNALEEQRLAKVMQVMTVPTTVLLDSQGTIAAWNAGLTQTQKIIDQYNKMAINPKSINSS
jgi:thiol-disulfide isomerase/thioredoxin